MLPDRVSNPGPLTYESGALPIALRGPAGSPDKTSTNNKNKTHTKSKAGSWIEGQVATMLKLHTKRIDKTDTTMKRANKRTTKRRQNRIAALGRPVMKLLGGFN